MRLELEPSAEPPEPPPGISGMLATSEPMGANPPPANGAAYAAPAESDALECSRWAGRLYAGSSSPPVSDGGDCFSNADRPERPPASALQGAAEQALAEPAARSTAVPGVGSPFSRQMAGTEQVAGPPRGGALAGPSAHSNGLPGLQAQERGQAPAREPDQAPASAPAPPAQQAAFRVCIDSALNLQLPASWPGTTAGSRSSSGLCDGAHDAGSAPNGTHMDGCESGNMLGRAHREECEPEPGPAAASGATAAGLFVWPPSGERVSTAPARIVPRLDAGRVPCLGANGGLAGAHLGPCARLGGAHWGFLESLSAPAAGARLSGALGLQVWLRPGSAGLPAGPLDGAGEDANGAVKATDPNARPGELLLGVARVDLAPLGCLGELRGWYHVTGPGCDMFLFKTLHAFSCCTCTCALELVCMASLHSLAC